MNILLCFKDTDHTLSFELVLVMYTTQYFEYSLEQLEEKSQQIMLMKVNLYLRLYFYIIIIIILHVNDASHTLVFSWIVISVLC